MQDRNSTLKRFALGLGLALVASGAIVAAQQAGTGPAQGARQDPGAPCCSITAIDLKAGVITAKVAKTGQVFTLSDIPAAALAKFKVGDSLDLIRAVKPSGGTTGVTGNAAGSNTTGTSSGGGSGTPGTNVPRGTDTRPKDCIATSSTGVQTPIACPQNVPIKTTK